jgi:tetratricopeptide (TPR) repeat protein
MAEAWTHARLRDYLDGEKGKGKRVKGNEAFAKKTLISGPELKNGQKGDAGAGELLRELIDQIKNGIEMADSMEEVQIPRTFDEIDELLMKLVAGNASRAEKKNFLSALYYSQHFYQRTLLKLEQLIPAQNEKLLPSLADIHLKSDEQIMSDLGLVKEKLNPDKQVYIFRIPVKFFQKVIQIFDFETSGKRRLIVATACFITILVAALFALRFYNTTYQMKLAEELLRENYRIYMEGTPRLSGGFQPTGIRTLMSNDQSGQDFIDEASQYANRALASDSSLQSAQYLKAKIMVIKSEYKSAADIFKQLEESGISSAPLYNDIGVTYFDLGKVEESVGYFQKALNKVPEFREAYYNLILAFQKLGRRTEAINLLKKYLEIEKDEGWRNAAGQLYDSLIKKDRGVQTSEKE